MPVVVGRIGSVGFACSAGWIGSVGFVCPVGSIGSVGRVGLLSFIVRSSGLPCHVHAGGDDPDPHGGGVGEAVSPWRTSSR